MQAEQQVGPPSQIRKSAIKGSSELLEYLQRSAEMSSFERMHPERLKSKLGPVPEEDLADVDEDNFALNRIRRLGSRRELKAEKAVFGVLQHTLCSCLSQFAATECLFDGDRLLAKGRRRLCWNFDATPFRIECGPRGFT